MSAAAQVLTSFEALARWAPELTADRTEADPFTTWSWFSNLAQQLGSAPAQLALVASRGAQPDAQCHVLPLSVQAHSRIALYGSSWASLSNYYSSLFAPLGPAPSLSQATLEAMLVAMRAQNPRHAVLDLRPLDKESPFFERMQAALSAQQYAVRPYFCFGNWTLLTQGRSYSQYEATLPSRVQSTLKRSRKKLDAAGPWTIAIERQAGPELERAIAHWQAVYDKSWKEAEPYPGFVPSLIRMAATKGWLRLAVLCLNEQPIAAQLWLVKDGRAYIYKLAYDQAFAKFSAGSVLTSELMRMALDVEHVAEVDYLTGDDAYKRDWMSHRRERMGLAAFRTDSLQGLSSLARHDLGALWRRWKPRKGQDASAQQQASGDPAK